MSSYRTCPRCGVEKPLTSEHFYASTRAHGGFQGLCKGCDNRARAERLKVVPSGITATSDGRPRAARFVCVRCCDLPHRREVGGCDVCGQPYGAERMPTVADVLEQPRERV